MNGWWWSWLLTAVGVFGLWLGGRRNYWGWFVGLMAQVLWMSYAVVTQQYGFIVSALAYAWVYGNNFAKWRSDAVQESRAKPECRHENTTVITLYPAWVKCMDCGEKL